MTAENLHQNSFFHPFFTFFFFFIFARGKSNCRKKGLNRCNAENRKIKNKNLNLRQPKMYRILCN